MQEGEYSGNIMYSCMKMRPVETILRMRGGRMKDNDGSGKFN
jgi:hypothetical protein